MTLEDPELSILNALQPDAPDPYWFALKAWEAWRVFWAETRAHRWVWLGAAVFTLCACVTWISIPRELKILHDIFAK